MGWDLVLGWGSMSWVMSICCNTYLNIQSEVCCFKRKPAQLTDGLEHQLCYIYMSCLSKQTQPRQQTWIQSPPDPGSSSEESLTWHQPYFGWHYSSKATCLIQPHLLYACFVVKYHHNLPQYSPYFIGWSNIYSTKLRFRISLETNILVNYMFQVKCRPCSWQIIYLCDCLKRRLLKW